MTVEEARRMRAEMELAAASLDDATASQTAMLFPQLRGNGDLVKSGARINWNGVVKRAAVDLWDTSDNTPDNAPTLWEDLLYRDGIRIIPDTITVGTAFSMGERGWWGDILYESKVDNNVYTPEQYPSNWTEVVQ